MTRPKTVYLRVEVRLRRVRDEELAAAGVRPVERHADGSAQVGPLVELVANRVAGSAFAVAARIAGLDHEVGHHAMEGQPSKNPCRASVTKLSTVSGASSTASSI